MLTRSPAKHSPRPATPYAATARPLLRRAIGALVVTGAMSALALTAATAQAVGGYHTSGAAVRVRADANTQSAQISTIPAAGTGIDIACQVLGENVTVPGFGTSAVWDRLNGYGNGYIADLFVSETPYGQFDPRIPRCNEPAPAPAPAPAPVVTREDKAVAWARGQLGHRLDDWGRATSGWCARWSVGAYGRQNSGYGTAYLMFKDFQKKGLTRTAGTAPAGTFVFFGPTPGNGHAGHVAIADGAGGMITTSSTVIANKSLSYAGAPYLGWSYAPDGWTR